MTSAPGPTPPRLLHLRTVAVLGLLCLGGCASPAGLQSSSAPSALPSAESAFEAETPADAPAAGAAADLPAERARPQLIRRASLRLRVESIATAQTKIEAIVRQQGGDILGLQTYQPEPGFRRSATLSLRVPQDRLNQTLDALAPLGTVLAQEITAEDVTNRLVDFDARLQNLRRAEATLLEIMDRSGTVADVLEVARELATHISRVDNI